MGSLLGCSEPLMTTEAPGSLGWPPSQVRLRGLWACQVRVTPYYTGSSPDVRVGGMSLKPGRAIIEDAGGSGAGCHLGSQVLGEAVKSADSECHLGGSLLWPGASGLPGPPPAALGIPGGLRSALLSHRQAQAWEGSGAGPLRGATPQVRRPGPRPRCRSPRPASRGELRPVGSGVGNKGVRESVRG